MISAVLLQTQILVNTRALFPIVFISLILLSYCYVGNPRRGSWKKKLTPASTAENSSLAISAVQSTSSTTTATEPTNGTVFHPWPHDPDCTTYFVHLAPNHTFTPRALVSFPGSGNSWLRYLIEAATGYFTGSVFQDQRLYDSGLLGEFRAPNDGSTIVQKTHHDTVYNGTKERLDAYVQLSEKLFQYRGVLLIRNPYDALLAYWNFIKTKTHKGITEMPSLNTTGWKHFVTSGSEKWESLISSWVERSPDLLIVLYEDLKTDPVGELSKILGYLEQPAADAKRMDCVRKYAEGPFHRTTTTTTTTPRVTNQALTEHNDTGIGAWTEMYAHAHGTEDLRSIVQQSIESANRALQQSQVPVHLNYSYTSSVQ